MGCRKRPTPPHLFRARRPRDECVVLTRRPLRRFFGQLWQSVQVWNAHTGRLFRSIRGLTGSVACAFFSPEGRRLATAGIDRIVRIWDFTRDQESHLLEKTGPARNVAFSPDGKFFAAAGFRHSSGVSLEKRVRLWSINENWQPRAWNGHTDWVSCVSVAPGSKLLASGSADKTVRIWDVATGRTKHVLAGHKELVTAARFSPDGRWLASASLDKTVRFWEVASGQPLELKLAHPEPVNDVAFSHDGRQLVTVGDHGMILVWDAETGNKLYALPGHVDAVQRALFSPDGRLLATAGLDRTIHIWDMTKAPETGRVIEPLRVLPGPSETERITGLAFTPDSRRLASSGRDHTIRLWDVASGDEMLTLRGQNDFVNDLAFSPDGRILASASSGNIRIWEASCETAPTLRRTQAAQSTASWHQQQADACETSNPCEWFGVAFHVHRTIEAGVDDWRLRIRLADAESEIGQWPQAIEDCSCSIELGADDPWVWLKCSVGELKRGDASAYQKTCMRCSNASPIPIIGSMPTTLRGRQQAGASGIARQPGRTDSAGQKSSPASTRQRALPQQARGHLVPAPVNSRMPAANCTKPVRLAKEDFPEDCLFLAMTYYKLGKAAEAGQWHQKAVHLLENMAKPKPDAAGCLGDCDVARAVGRRSSCCFERWRVC